MTGIFWLTNLFIVQFLFNSKKT